MRFLLCLMAVIAITATSFSFAHADTIRVPADQPTIQAGIDAAMPGDDVLVAPGTYTGAANKNLNFHGKDIVVHSESGAGLTTIDCEGLGRGFFLLPPLSANAVVSGFTIANGAIGAAEGGGGMAIFGCSPTIESCIFTLNSTSGEGGGAIVSQGSSSVIRDCTFDQNSATGELGGAIFAEASSLSLIRCTFTANTAREGGGVVMVDILVDGGNGDRAQQRSGQHATVDQCTFSGNQASSSTGAMFLGVTTSSVTNSIFDDNRAGSSGALVAFNATIADCEFTRNTSTNVSGALEVIDCSVSNCLFSHNSSVQGGAVRALSFEGTGSSFTRCVFFENTATTGGAASVGSNDAFENCTMVRNSAANGSGIWVRFRGSVEVTRSIIAFGQGEGVACDNLATADLSCCDVYGNKGGDWTGCIAGQLGVDGNIAADPLFCDLSGGNLTLCADSPCAPAQSGACELIGALDVGCGTCGVTALEPTTWGRIKALHGR